MGIPPGVFGNALQGVAIGAPIAGGIQEAGALRQQADAQAAAARYNAQLARMEGDAEASRIRRAGRRELGRQRAILGASGVRAEGSPIDVLADNAFEIAREAAHAQIAGRNTARLDEAQARQAKRAGRIGAGTALLGGAIKAGSTAMQLSQSRPPRR